jgi:hypothetical protein
MIRATNYLMTILPLPTRRGDLHYYEKRTEFFVQSSIHVFLIT